MKITSTEILQKFDLEYQRDRERLNDLLTSEDDTQSLLLFRWIMQSGYNPYGIISNDEIGHMTQTLSGCVSLYSLINHAYIDDGEISLIVPSWGSPKIFFTDDDEYILQEIKDYSIVDLMIRDLTVYRCGTVSEFIIAYEDYEKRIADMWEEHGEL